MAYLRSYTCLAHRRIKLRASVCTTEATTLSDLTQPAETIGGFFFAKFRCEPTNLIDKSTIGANRLTPPNFAKPQTRKWLVIDQRQVSTHRLYLSEARLGSAHLNFSRIDKKSGMEQFEPLIEGTLH